MSANAGVAADPSEIARKIQFSLAKHHIAQTPENYHVWYIYHQGSDPDLTACIDRIISAGKAFTAEVNAELYRRFAIREEKENLEDTQKETSGLLNSIVVDLVSSNARAGDYESFLNGLDRQLSSTGGIEPVQQLVQELAAETARMAASSHELQSKLEAATAQAETLRKRLEQVESVVLTDELTGLANRRAIERQLADRIRRYETAEEPFVIMLLDVDYFKAFNDTYGHNVGDNVLRLVGQSLREYVNGVGFCGRYGGEEFMVVLPSTTVEDARAVADKIRVRISEKQLTRARTGEKLRQVTASLGLAEVKPEDNPETLVERADRALYLAKQTGRNRVCCEKELGGAAGHR